MIIFLQVLKLFSFIMAGYLLSKFRLVSRDQAPILSRLLANVFVPCLALKTFSTNFTVKNLSEQYPLMLCGLVVVSSVVLVSTLLARILTKNHYMRHVYSYSMAIPNFGYIGYPLVQGLLGDAGLFSFMLFVLAANAYVYSIGFCTLTKQPFNLKGFLNGMTIPLLLGMIFGLLQIPVPAVAMDILTSAGNCIGPVGMILAGIVISEYNLADLIKDKTAYIVTFVRLIAIPLSVGFTLKLLGLHDLALYATLFCTLPCGLNTIVYPKLVNEDCKFGAKMAFLTNILCCITIPINLHILGIQ
ncbi:MAG: hypothetical protein E7293_07410 [Lachnospiraceae bacterium]|nr:hypothetical protein [Lachnospiraceae bacterium]